MRTHNAERQPSRRARSKAARRIRADALALVPQDGDLDALVDAISQDRGRPIRVTDRSLSAGTSGLWLVAGSVDVIVAATGLDTSQRRMTICHELAHILCGHTPTEGHLDSAVVAPDIDPAVAARFLRRHDFVDDAESEAESLATVLATALAQRAAVAAARSAADTVSMRLR